jgi:hypothetical protein
VTPARLRARAPASRSERHELRSPPLLRLSGGRRLDWPAIVSVTTSFRRNERMALVPITELVRGSGMERSFRPCLRPPTCYSRLVTSSRRGEHAQHRTWAWRMGLAGDEELKEAVQSALGKGEIGIQVGVYQQGREIAFACGGAHRPGRPPQRGRFHPVSRLLGLQALHCHRASYPGGARSRLL